MILLGLDMLKIISFASIIPFGATSNIFRKLENILIKDPHKSAFVLGAITYFLPCGFTQATQVYALGLASPWQSLVMILITLPFLAKTHNRRSIASAVLICVALAFVYHVFGAVCLALGHSGKIPAFISAWLAHVLFAGGALAYMDRGNY